MSYISKTSSIAITGVIVLIILLYSFTVDYPFLYDDDPVILNNYTIRSFDAGRVFLSNLPRPLLALTFAANYSISELNPESYRILNIIIHICNSVLVFFFIFSLFKNYSDNDNFFHRYAESTSLLSCLIFAVHPTAVESVTYISSRSTILSAFFFLLALIFFEKYFFSSFKKKGFYIVSLLSFSCGFLVKENLLVLPLICLLFEILFAHKKEQGAGKKKSPSRISYGLYIPYAVIIALYSFARVTLVKDLEHGIHIRSYYSQFLSQVKVSLFYLRILFFPVNLNICHDIAEVDSFFSVQGFLSVLFLTALIAGVFRFFRREKIVVFFSLWFLINLAPTSAFPLDDLASERWIYLPSVGIVTLLAVFTVKCLTTASSGMKNKGGIILGVSAVLVVLFSLLTYDRNHVWESQFKLWSDSVKKSPFKDRSHLNLGMSLEGMQDYKGALKEYKKTIDLNPSYALPYNNIGVIYCNTSDFDAAIPWFKRAIQIDSKYADSHYNLALVYKQMGMIDEAIDEYKKTEGIKPDDVSVCRELGFLYMQIGKTESALPEFEKVLRLMPKDWEVLKETGKIYFSLGNYDASLNDLQKSLKLNPQSTESLLYIAMNYTAIKNYDGAIEIYKMLMKSYPENEEAGYSLAVNYLEKGDIENAEMQLNELLEKNNNKKYHNLLGALYLKSNQLDKAEFHFSEALKIDSGYEMAKKNLEIAKRISARQGK